MKFGQETRSIALSYGVKYVGILTRLGVDDEYSLRVHSVHSTTVEQRPPRGSTDLQSEPTDVDCQYTYCYRLFRRSYTATHTTGNSSIDTSVTRDT